MRTFSIRTLLSGMLLQLIFSAVRGQFHAIHIPDGKLSQLKVDGDRSDWDWVPEEKFITRNSLNEFVYGAALSLKAWDCKFLVGWSEITNRIYLLSIVYDKKRD